MRIRIGYGGPPGFPHGNRHYKNRDPRGMTDFERLIHLIVSLQILFGSRRGGLLIPLLVIGLGVGGYFAFQYYKNPDFFRSPEQQLEVADEMWDSAEFEDKKAAIGSYKKLLRKRDPVNDHLYWLQNDRDRLYRAIIKYHVMFDKDSDQAKEWIIMAWEHDDFRKLEQLNFHDDEVIEFWNETITGLKKLKRSPGKFSDDDRLNDLGWFSPSNLGWI